MTFDPIEERDATIAALRAELAQAQAEVAHWKHHAWEAGEGFKRAIEGTNRAHAYRRAAEAEIVALREAIEALADNWEGKAEKHVDRAAEDDCAKEEAMLQIGTAGGRIASATDLRAALAAEPTPAAEPHAEDGA